MPKNNIFPITSLVLTKSNTKNIIIVIQRIIRLKTPK